VKKAGWIIVYVLAVIIVLGRLGSSTTQGLYGLLKVAPLTGAQAMGYVIEGFVEDFIVVLAILRFVHWIRTRKSAPAPPST
jgi:hypothetical protein